MTKSPQSLLQEIEVLSNNKAQVIAVSKLQSLDRIKSLYQIGQRSFAENYVQEALDKQSQLNELKIEWHFIGSLQKNKVKNVVGAFHLIHSVDSLPLAQKISQKAGELGISQKILLQLNLAQELTKSGFSEIELRKVWNEISKLPNLVVQGLMTMPPLFPEHEKVRPYFRRLREIRDELLLQELSMGTSSDYKIALEEGATMIRLGTILFGERN